MSEPFKLTRVATLKTVADFRAHVAALGLDLPCEDQIVAGDSSPLAQPIDSVIEHLWSESRQHTRSLRATGPC